MDNLDGLNWKAIKNIILLIIGLIGMFMWTFSIPNYNLVLLAYTVLSLISITATIAEEDF